MSLRKARSQQAYSFGGFITLPSIWPGFLGPYCRRDAGRRFASKKSVRSHWLSTKPLLPMNPIPSAGPTMNAAGTWAELRPISPNSPPRMSTGRIRLLASTGRRPALLPLSALAASLRQYCAHSPISARSSPTTRTSGKPTVHVNLRVAATESELLASPCTAIGTPGPSAPRRAVTRKDSPRRPWDTTATPCTALMPRMRRIFYRLWKTMKGTWQPSLLFLFQQLLPFERPNDPRRRLARRLPRSEEHTSELQSP